MNSDNIVSFIVDKCVNNKQELFILESLLYIPISNLMDDINYICIDKRDW